MEIMIILILVVIVGILIGYIIGIKKKISIMIMGLNAVKKGERRKLFIKGPQCLEELNHCFYEVIGDYETKIEHYSKNDELNKTILTSLSHDVRTPLTSLLGYLEMVNYNAINENEKSKYIKIAAKKAYELKEYVENLFLWFKINSREQVYQFEILDINEYTREILVDWIPIFEEKRISLIPIISDEETLVSIDQYAYRRIINNLIQNAINHSGSIDLKLEINPNPNQVEVTIEDHGVGIPENEINHIFERLYKCDTSRSKSSNGLGLSIVRELVKEHKGSIQVMSIPNIKTVFTIILPRNI